MTDSDSGRRSLRGWIRSLDHILRGDTTRLDRLRAGRIDYPLAGIAFLAVLLAGAYGFCVGWFALFNRPDGPSFEQLFYSTVKMPLLFLLTLVVTFPSLYVFNALVGSRLRLAALVRLLVAAMAVTLAVLASFGPIVAFFAITTNSYPFISLLNVFFCAVGGLLGLAFLLQTLHRLSISAILAEPPAAASTDNGGADAPPADGGGADEPVETDGEAESHYEAPAPTPGDDAGALDAIDGHVLGRHTKTVFKCWMILFALVGGQMGWVLRPFIGDPNQTTQFLRPRESNFFQAVWETFLQLFQ